MADKNNILHLVLIILAAVLIFNPSLTGNLQYNIASSYGPSKSDNFIASAEPGRVVVVPSFGEKSGDGTVNADVEVCIGDAKLGGSAGKISSLTEAQEAAISLADTSCYLECLRFGGSISPLFTRQLLDSRYVHTCKRVNVQCFCTI